MYGIFTYKTGWLLFGQMLVCIFLPLYEALATFYHFDFGDDTVLNLSKNQETQNMKINAFDK